MKKCSPFLSRIFDWFDSYTDKRQINRRKTNLILYICSLFSHQVMSNSSQPHELQHTRLPCPSSISRCLPKFISITLAMPSNHWWCQPVYTCKSESCSVLSNSLWPHGLYSPWNTGVGSFTLPNSGIKPRSPALQADSLPAEPQGSPIHMGVHKNVRFQGKIF